MSNMSNSSIEINFDANRNKLTENKLDNEMTYRLSQYMDKSSINN